MVAHPAALPRYARAGENARGGFTAPLCTARVLCLAPLGRGFPPPPAPRSLALARARGCGGHSSTPHTPRHSLAGGTPQAHAPLDSLRSAGASPLPSPKGERRRPLRAGKRKRPYQSGRALHRYASAQDSLICIGIGLDYSARRATRLQPIVDFFNAMVCLRNHNITPWRGCQPPMQKKFTTARGERAAPSAHSRN